MTEMIQNLVIVHKPSNQNIPVKEVAGNVTADEILEVVVNHLNLPGNNGAVLYRKLTGKQLFPHETLSSAGIEDDEVLIAEVETVNIFGQAEFIDNPEPRCPCILLLDVSGSMSGAPIEELNAGLRKLKESLMTDSLASLRVEIAIITFGAGVEVAHDFMTVNQFNPPTFTVSGTTPMGAAINKALDKLQERKQMYKQNGISYYRPWLFLITDGEPTDKWEPAAQRVKEAENRKSVAFFCVGVQQANMDILKQISPRQPVKLKALKDFSEMFKWLSSSLTSTSHSNIGDSVPLQSPLGWGEI
jgi:uncharacterized protein YegL